MTDLKKIGNSNFRIPKCLHNDCGYCKFGDKCRKRHFKDICNKEKCDKNCEGRHPKHCKFESKCRFFKKGICAFKHVTLAIGDGENKALKLKLKHLEMENERLTAKVIQMEVILEKEMANAKLKSRDKTTSIGKKIISVVLESHESPSTKLNDDEPTLDKSSCINYPCDKCDFEFDEEDDLDAHNEIYHENSCELCGIDFEEEDALKTHKEIVHQSNILDAGFEEEVNDKRCDECDFGSTTEKGLKIHKGMKHKQTLNETYSCDKCKRFFADNIQLEEHKKTMHRAFLTF